MMEECKTNIRFIYVLHAIAEDYNIAYLKCIMKLNLQVEFIKDIFWL